MTNPSLSVNYISSKKSNDELKFKLTQFKSHTNALEMKFWRLNERLKRTITQHGITLKSKENEDMMNLMGSYGEDVARAFPDENSFQRLFWEQQLKG